MRDIKFRVWDTKNNKMTIPFDLQDFANDQDGEIGMGDFSISWYDYKRKPPMVDNILMQYTGHKDINGDELYEGDICRIIDRSETDSNDYSGMEVTIVWDDRHSGFIGRTPQICIGAWHDWLKKIGNIYENSKMESK